MTAEASGLGSFFDRDTRSTCADDEWADLAQRREAVREELDAWVSARVQELGSQAYPYSGEVANLIAQEAADPDPRLTVSMVAGHLHHCSGSYVHTPTETHTLDISRGAVWNRTGVERDLDQLLGEARHPARAEAARCRSRGDRAGPRGVAARA